MKLSEVEFWLRREDTMAILHVLHETFPVNFYKCHHWDEVNRQKGRKDILDLMTDKKRLSALLGG